MIGLSDRLGLPLILSGMIDFHCEISMPETQMLFQCPKLAIFAKKKSKSAK